MLVSRHFGGAPVIDATRNCVGVVSLRDIARYRQHYPGIRVYDHDFYSSLNLESVSEDSAGELVVERESSGADDYVEKIMTPLVLAVEEEASIAEVVRLIVHHHVHRIFVMDENQHLVGIVSTTDILEALLRTLDPPSGGSSPDPPASGVRTGRRASRRRPGQA